MVSVAPIAARAAVVREIGKPFQFEEIEVAPPREHEVRVRVVGAGICHTDLIVRDGFNVPVPVVLGHEGSGVVESVGSHVKNVKKGDHVVLSYNSCGACPACRLQQPPFCEQFFPNNFSGVRPQDGSSPLSCRGAMLHGNFFGQSSFATYAIAHERNTVVVEPSLPLELLGPLGCGIQTGAGTVANTLRFRKGQSIAIFGGGSVGLAGLLAAVAIGASKVIVIELNPERAKLARSLGATHVIDPQQTPDLVAAIREAGGGGVHHAMDTTGRPQIHEGAFQALLPGGMLALIGVPPPNGTLTLSLMDLLVRGVGVKGVLEGDSDPQLFIPQMLRWYQEGRFPFDRLIGKFPFDQINEACHATETGKVVKPLLLMPASR
jgi:aryl-alcohol dehydrogenase/geraniol dehydrogenase (NAD+)